MGSETSIFKKLTIESEVQYSCKHWSLFNAKYDSHKFSVFMFNDFNTQYSFDISVSILFFIDFDLNLKSFKLIITEVEDYKTSLHFEILRFGCLSRQEMCGH